MKRLRSLLTQMTNIPEGESSDETAPESADSDGSNSGDGPDESAPQKKRPSLRVIK